MKLSRLLVCFENITSSAGIFTGIGVLIVTMSGSTMAFKFLEYLLICHIYGQAAWQHGLRVINKGGGLSNGDNLDGWPDLILYFGSFGLTVILFSGSILLFSYIGMRLAGRRPTDSKPKKKWISSGKSDSK